MCTEESERQSAVFVGVYLYRVAPSLYDPILGLVWWYFQHSLWPTSSTQWMGGQSHCLCLFQSSLLCFSLEALSSCSGRGLIMLSLPTFLFLCAILPVPQKNPIVDKLLFYFNIINLVLVYFSFVNQRD